MQKHFPGGREMQKLLFPENCTSTNLTAYRNPPLRPDSDTNSINTNASINTILFA
jgi:hypothetical protein